MAIELNGEWVWAVVGSDLKSDEPEYTTYVSLFANREEARKYLRNSAEDDARCLEDKVVWYGRDTENEMCKIYYGGEPRVVYTLTELKIH